MKSIMKEEIFDIVCNNQQRILKARLCYFDQDKRPLIIMAAGLHSFYTKPSQKNIARWCRTQGFATLQFNYMGHGSDENKSDGDLKNVTISTGVDDIVAVYRYAKNNLSDRIDTRHIFINANSYGAFCAWRALDCHKDFCPTAMAFVGPYDPKAWMKKLQPFANFAPTLFEKIAKPFKLTAANINDFCANHTEAMQIQPKSLGNIPLLCIGGKNDHISNAQKCQQLANQFSEDLQFPFGRQTNAKIVPGGHFNTPPSLQMAINMQICTFFYRTLPNADMESFFKKQESLYKEKRAKHPRYAQHARE